MNTDDRLKALVTKIEIADISDEAKDILYTTLRDNLKKGVWPILYKYIPLDEAKRLAENLDTVTPEAYFALVKKALINQEAMKELEHYMNKILEVAENAFYTEFQMK